MLNTTFNPDTIDGFTKNLMAVDWQSVQATVTAGSTQSIDFFVPEDMLLVGLQMLAKGSLFGDTATLQIVCVTGTLLNGVTICPPNSVLNQFGTNIGMCDDMQTKIDMVAQFPAKLQGGLTIRCIYNSTGSSPVQVIMNYKLLSVLQ